mmetsp:Transcript_54884/g.157830  ORF Transcript_54884/g.157830 Transcript_54884/m.157830 type:complete len:590 (-) Transcript_54884:34-1803(-)
MALPPLNLPPRGLTGVGGEFGLSNDRFRLVTALSNGGQGAVYVCRRLTSGEDFAVKVIDRTQLSMCQRNEVLLRREIRTLRELQHRNVVSLHDAFWESGSCFIVMDLAKEGDLRQKVTLHVGLGEDPTSAEHASRFVGRQLVSGINYMHRRRVIHRDLKLENILVVSSRPSEAPYRCRSYDVKITDFGLSTWLDIVGEEMTPCGTPNYLAPEVFRNHYDERVDFWSFGVVLYIMLCGSFPFDAYHNPADVLQLENQEIKDTLSWQLVSESAKNFVTGLLAYDPEQRLAHGGCLRHQWLSMEAASSGFFPDAETASAFTLHSPCGSVSAELEALAKRCGAVAAVRGWTGAALDNVSFHLRSGATESHGGTGGFNQLRFVLNPDEVIVAVSQENRNGLSEHLGNAITFFTSACNVFEFKGTDARRRRRFVSPSGSQIVGLQFAGSRLAGIHLEEVATEGVVAGVVEQISGRCGYAVDQVQMKLRYGVTRCYGTSGGFEQGTFVLEPDEYIIVVEQGRRDAFLGNSIAFFTSAGNVYRLSGMEASVSRRFAVPTGEQVCGIDFDGPLLASVRTCSQHVSCPEASDIRLHTLH